MNQRPQLNIEQTTQLLQARFDEVAEIVANDVPDGAEASVNESVLSARIAGGILGRFGDFLGDNADLLPPKETVLAAVEKAVDLAFAAIGRPFIASLIKPIVMQMILRAAGNMYDAVANPTRTEV